MDAPPPDASTGSVLPERRRGRRRGTPSGLADPGLVTVASGVLLLIVALVAVWAGWSALLLSVLLTQVVVARSWVEWLEVPASTLCSVAVLVVAGVADVGVVVARASATPPYERADGLDQLVPAVGALFLVAVLAQLVRRDDPAGTGPRPGAVGGMVATTTGGAVVVGLALWLPLLAARSGAGLVLLGAGVAATVVVVVGALAWVRRTDLPPPTVVVPVVVALLAGPFYAIGRLSAG